MRTDTLNALIATVVVLGLMGLGPLAAWSQEETSGPQISLVRPVEGQDVRGHFDDPGGPECRAEVTSEGGVDHVDFAVDGNFINRKRSAPYACLWDTRNYSDGEHVLTATAYDAAGNSSTDTIRVHVDNAPPEVSIVTPTEGQTVRGKLDDPGGSECEAAVTDDAGVERVDWSVDGEHANRERSAPYTCVWDTRNYTNGDHVLTATAHDAAGNSSTQSIRVSVDNRLWRGDAETGDLSQWSKRTYNCRVDGVLYHDNGHCRERIQVVDSPTSGPHSRYAYRFEVRDGDYSRYGGERNEVKQTDAAKQYPRGSHRFFGYSVMLPDTFPLDNQGVANDWSALSSWKTVETHGSGAAALNMQTGGERLSLKHASDPAYYLWRFPLTRGVWHRFVVRVRFHPDPDVGFVELWRDGERVLPKTYASTLEPMNGYADPAYSKIGYYRNAAIPGTSAVYIDDYTVGTSYQAVAPPRSEP